MPTSGASGTITLMAAHEESNSALARTVRLEACADGKTLLLVDVDSRRPGISRTARYEITAPELIAFVRAHGVDLTCELPALNLP